MSAPPSTIEVIQFHSDTDTTATIVAGHSNANDFSSEIRADRRNSGLVREFNQREQELTEIVRRMSNGGIVDDKDLTEFAHELTNYHCFQIQKLVSHLGTSLSDGLHKNTVSERLSKDGPNSLPKSHELPLIVRFALCFTNGFSPLLWIAFVFVFLSYEPFGTPPSNIYNLALAIAILVVIFLSGIFTFIQEVQSSLALAAFSDLVPPNCVVLRDGVTSSISPTQLVVGDIVCLETGMRVPSDLRIVSTRDLKIDKSTLTGENEPVRLISNSLDPVIPMLQARNMAFMGCNVVEGEGVGIVIATGKKNQLAKIAAQVGEVAMVATSLQKEINRFVVIIGVLALITAIVVILVWAEYLNVKHNGFMTTSSMIANAISVLVAFVPEGLPLALQTGLTIIANRLCVKHQVLVKQLSIIETVGSMTLLASDKTGTLTQNKMKVSNIVTAHSILPKADVAKDIPSDMSVFIIQACVLCNQCKQQVEGDQRVAVGSNGIDKAILNWSEELGEVDHIRDLYDVVLLMPFSSVTKISSVVIGASKGGLVRSMVPGLASPMNMQTSFRVVSKGAPEYVLDRCSFYMDEKTNKVVPLSPDIVDKILKNIQTVASTGKRVIAIAHLPLSNEEYGFNHIFRVDPQPNFPLTGLIFLACVAVSDPPREGVDKAIETLRGAGITVAMVTGDAVNTATAIAQQIGIISPVEDGQQIDNLHDFNELEKALSGHLDVEAAGELTSSATKLRLTNGSTKGSAKSSTKGSAGYENIDVPARRNSSTAIMEAFAKTSSVVIDGRDLATISPLGWNFIFAHTELVFARTSPDQKLQIVMESQRRGHRVGVTGDGVNDSPALKRADVGIAMGMSGSDVARDAASVVLLNDDFTAVTKAVEEGRLIFANLRKVIGYQIAAGCWSELIPVLATFFIGMPQPLSSFLMIIISCSTDVLAGIALMNEPPEKALMKEKPRNLKTSHLVNFKLIGYSYLFYGNLQSVGSFVNYFLYMSERGPRHRVPDPVPADDDGTRMFPAGYIPAQLINAWNWGAATNADGNLATDETNASSVASSVFFVTLVVCQMGHLLTIRRKTPYFSDAIMGSGGGGVFARLWAEILECRPQPRILLAWIGAAVIANIFNEIPAVQTACGTGSVPGRYWGIAIGWSVLCFSLNEIRKWIVLLYPDSIVGRVSYELSE